MIRRAGRHGKYVVIRKPSVQEDEGRYFVIREFDDYRKAWAWINKQKGNYFSDKCYVVAHR